MFWLLLIVSYLLGSLSFAIILCTLLGKDDPRFLGSKNPGATNVLRIAGKRIAILTLLGDTLKGLIAVGLAKFLYLTEQQQAWIGLSAVIGHLYPVYFQFKGGKGIATAAGVFLMLAPITLLVGTIVWGFIFYCSRISSLSSLSALLTIVILTIIYSPPLWAPVLIIFLLILWRHHHNLHDLIKGIEQHF